MKKLITFLVSALIPLIGISQCELGQADFTYIVNPNCSVTFMPCSSAGMGSWQFGDGQSTNNVQGTTHCYLGNGSYYVTHTFMGMTVSKYINVSCNPSNDFTFTVNGCCVTFNALNHCATAGNWTFGDGTGASTTNQTSHCYSANGIYTVTYSLGNGLPAVTKQVSITGCNTCTADFTYTLAGCCVKFTGTNTCNAVGSWTFGNGASANNTNQTTYCFTQNGTYNVTYTAGTASKSKTVTIADCSDPCQSTTLDAKFCRINEEYEWTGSWPDFTQLDITNTYENQSIGNYVASQWKACWEEYDCDGNLIAQGCEYYLNQPTIELVNTYCTELEQIVIWPPFKYAWIRLHNKRIYTSIELTIWDSEGCSDVALGPCIESLTGGGQGDNAVRLPEQADNTLIKVEESGRVEVDGPKGISSPTGDPIIVAEVNPTLVPLGADIEIRLQEVSESPTEVLVFDINGRRVHKSIIEPNSGLQHISSSHFSKGVFFVQLKNGAGLDFTKKILLY